MRIKLNYLSVVIVILCGQFMAQLSMSMETNNLMPEKPRSIKLLDLPNEVLIETLKFGAAKSAHPVCQKLREVVSVMDSGLQTTIKNETEFTSYESSRALLRGSVVNCLFPITEDHVRRLMNANPSLKILRQNGKSPPLTKLSLRHAQPASFEIIPNICCLEFLDLGYSSFTNTKFLLNLKSLKTLMINNLPLNDISSVSQLSELENLYIHNTDISSLAALKDLKNLTHLCCSFCPISDLTPLEGLTQLKQLYLNGTKISNIDSLKSLTNIEYLNVSFTNIPDIQVLSGHKKLQGLFMESTPVTDLSPLACATQMRKLYLPRTQVINISVLGNFNQLEQLTLSYTDVADFSPLLKLNDLVTLNIVGHKNSRAVAESLKSKKKLKVRF